MAELPGVTFIQRLAQRVQQLDARRSNADADDAAIVGRALARYQAALLQFVEQTRDIRCATDETGCEVKSAYWCWVIAAEQAEGVVLLRRQVVLHEQLVFQGPQSIVRPPEA